MGWTTYSNVSNAAWIVDHTSVTRDTGRQIDWANVASGRANADGKKFIAAGTIMAELASGKIIPRADVSGSETSTCLLATNATEDAPYNAKTGHGCILGGVVYGNLLPDAADEDIATWKGELQAAGVGTGFAFKTYADSRAS